MAMGMRVVQDAEAGEGEGPAVGEGGDCQESEMEEERVVGRRMRWAP